MNKLTQLVETHSTKITTALLVVVALLHFTLNKIPSQTEVNFLNIGQGDSTLIVTGELQTILIDGGPGETVLEELGKILPFFVRDIDLMILTHPHRDHLEGLIEVLKRYNVRHALIAGDQYGSGLYREFLKRINQDAQSGRTTLHFAEAGMDIKLKTNHGELFLDILHPFQNIAGKEYDNTNNASIVLKMSQENAPQAFLFTGDCEEECEHEILGYYNQINELEKLKADVLKVGHHGSRTSTTKELLNAVSPKIAIIQSGVDNQFEHPHQETIKKLEGARAEVRRNDMEKTITIKLAK